MDFVHSLFEQIATLVDSLGYLGIFLLMALESSFVPFPSEIVLIPAGYLVKEGKMTAAGVMLAGVGGSLLGAYINYFISATFGRRFILKYGKYFLLDEAKFASIEAAFNRHGKFATFVGRLIFGIRQWISIPAGLSRMAIVPFSILTSAGAAVWVAILVSLGYVLGAGESTAHTAKLVGYWMAGAVAIMSLAYMFWWVPRKNGSSKNTKAGSESAAKKVNGVC